MPTELRFSMVGLNSIFNICVIFKSNYFLVVCEVLIDSDTFLVTDFVNLRIKSTQYFKNDHKNSVCILIGVNTCMYINMFVLYF
jgi:hypothetical protein